MLGSTESTKRAGYHVYAGRIAPVYLSIPLDD